MWSGREGGRGGEDRGGEKVGVEEGREGDLLLWGREGREERRGERGRKGKQRGGEELTMVPQPLIPCAAYEDIDSKSLPLT